MGAVRDPFPESGECRGTVVVGTALMSKKRAFFHARVRTRQTYRERPSQVAADRAFAPSRRRSPLARHQATSGADSSRAHVVASPRSDARPVCPAARHLVGVAPTRPRASHLEARFTTERGRHRRRALADGVGDSQPPSRASQDSGEKVCCIVRLLSQTQLKD